MRGYYWKDFHKRKNSTKRPLNGEEITFTIKTPTSVYNPSVNIESGEDWFVSPPVYFQIGEMYYYVEDVVSYRQNVWELTMSLDVMATCRENIGSVNAYVVRASSGYNIMLVDDKISPEAETGISGSSVSTGIFDGGESYILQVLDGSGSQSSGFMHTYGLSSGELGQLSAALCDPSAYETLRQGFADVTSCIGSSIMLPVSLGKLPGGGDTIMLGDYPSGVSGKNITSPVISSKASVNIPWTYDDFRRQSPFTYIWLYLPYIGNVSINTNDVFSYESIDIYTALDIVTGVVSYSVQVGAGGIVIGEYSAMCGSPIPTSSYYTNYMGGISGAVGAMSEGIMSVLSYNPAMLGHSVGSAISAGFNFCQHTAQVRGAQGSIAINYTSIPFIRLELISRSGSDEPVNIGTVCGRPVYARKTIGSLSGYIQTSGAQIAGKYPDNIKAQVNAIMDGGFFYE